MLFLLRQPDKRVGSRHGGGHGRRYAETEDLRWRRHKERVDRIGEMQACSENSDPAERQKERRAADPHHRNKWTIPHVPIPNGSSRSVGVDPEPKRYFGG
jgi:hypothetical protein